MEEIDWTVFKGDSKYTCICNCGKVYKSHAKYIVSVKSIITKDVCPGCGKHHRCIRILSEKETF